VDLRLSDASSRRIGKDPVSGAFVSDMPKASYTPVTNPQPNAPVGPRGLVGTGIRLDEPADGRYLLEVIGTDRVSFDVAVEEWDRTGRRRWLHLSRGATEPGAVDRYELIYAVAAKFPIELEEKQERSYLSVRAYGTLPNGDQELVSELRLTDPRGRRLGFDPRSKKQIQEIPRAGYGEAGQTMPMLELEVLRPLDGTYTLEVLGTRSGRYDFSLYGVDSNGDSTSHLNVDGIPTAPGVAHRYVFTYASAPNAPTPNLTGAWGQGARLLTYAHPIGPRTELPPGQRRVALIVFYAATIVPESFRATLNGVDVSPQFKPGPGGHDVVSLALGARTSTLTLSVSGTDTSGQTASHRDQLVFVRR
jgi:hypothetical protein